MGVKWTESRDQIVTDWTTYRAMIVSGPCYTEGTETERESQSC